MPVNDAVRSSSSYCMDSDEYVDASILGVVGIFLCCCPPLIMMLLQLVVASGRNLHGSAKRVLPFYQLIFSNFL